LTTLYLIRHAQSLPSPQQPEPDWPLSPLGLEQAAGLVRRLLVKEIFGPLAVALGVPDAEGPGPHHAPVMRIPLLADELEALEPGEEPRNVRLGGDHPAADGRTGKPARLCAAQNPEHVVLRRGYAPGAGLHEHGAAETVGGAQQTQQSLFFQACKGALLRDFQLQSCHRRLISQGVENFRKWCRPNFIGIPPFPQKKRDAGPSTPHPSDEDLSLGTPVPLRSAQMG